MAYSEPDVPVTGTSISSANFGIKVANNQIDHQSRILALEANPVKFAKFVLSGNKTITANDNTTIDLWTAESDTEGWLSTSTNILPGAGIYMVSCQYYLVSIDAGASAWANLQKHSGVTDTLVSYYPMRNDGALGGNFYGILPPVIVSLAAGDYLWLKIWNGNASSNTTMNADAAKNFLNIIKLGE